jgi:hypothetical protein
MEAMLGVALLSVIIGGGLLAFWIWTLVDVVKVPNDDRFRAGNQLIWILVIIFTQVIGSVIYLIVGRPAPGMRR